MHHFILPIPRPGYLPARGRPVSSGLCSTSSPSAEMLEALVRCSGIDWTVVDCIHLDEYVLRSLLYVVKSIINFLLFFLVHLCPHILLPGAGTSAWTTITTHLSRSISNCNLNAHFF